MQQFTAMPNQMSNFAYGQDPDITKSVADPTDFKVNNYGAGAAANLQYDPTPSTTIARRPNNRQLVPTAQRNPYDISVDPWHPFGDDTMLDPQFNGGRMEENDNIELLEEKAAVAKRDAQSKRKQIPPFVQKLSR